MIRVFRHYISRAYLILFFVEFWIFFAAMYFGSDVRFLFTESWYSELDITQASFIFATALILACSGLGLYRRTLSWHDYSLLARASVSFIIGVFAIILLYYVIPEMLIARSVLWYAVMFAFAGLMLSRLIFYRLANVEQLKRRVLVIGSGKKAQQLISVNDAFIHKSFTIIGFIAFPGENSRLVDPALIIEPDKSLSEIAEDLRVDEIVVAVDDKRKSMPLDQLLNCKMSGLAILDMMAFYEREQGLISLDNVYPSWLVFSDGFAQGGFRAPSKRLFDILASVLLLLVAWPFMLITMLAIWLEDGFGSPVFYRQTRVGENNVNFDVLKFRSMRPDAEKNGAQWAQRQDSRVTRVGALIRKCRIDELPQIFNVLKGDMSFVGPRPERPVFVEGFEQRIPYYRERHRVKPGITGWAQLCYPYGASEYDTIQKLQYDLYYVKNYSLFLDISIMLNTVEVILWGKGAR